MKLTRVFTKIFCFLYYLTRFKHIKTAWLFAHYQLSLKKSQLVKTVGNNLEFLHSGNKIPLHLLPLYALEINLLVRSLNYQSVKVVSTGPEGFIAEISGVHLLVKSVSNLFTLNEIFQSTLYGISSNASNIVVLDIGMNVGFASLYFACLSITQTVYGYEPFPETYKEALENIELNPALKDKIHALNYGISNRNGWLEVPALEGGSAVGSTSDLFINANETLYRNSGMMKVEVRNITDVLQSILQQHPGQPVYLKVDCEGEEYAIFEALETSGLLQKITGVLLEWHIKGPEELTDRLKTANFTVLSLPIHSPSDLDKPIAGMLYAFR